MGLEETLALIPAISPWRERPELLSRLAPLNPPASGARDVPARSGSECNRRLGEGSRTSRLSEPLRPGTGRAPERATSRRAAGPNAIGDLGRVPARAGCRSRCDLGAVALQRRVMGGWPVAGCGLRRAAAPVHSPARNSVEGSLGRSCTL